MGPTEIRKSILIVKSQPKSLAAVEAFLRNRGWKIQSTTDLKDALQILVQTKPSFVMISVDHQNKKIRALPKLLVQSFPVFVMGFSEFNTTLAYKALIDSGAPYRINPPVTGPAVERTINKIIRDQQTEREKQAAAERATKMAREKDSESDERGDLHDEQNKAVSFAGVEGGIPSLEDPEGALADLSRQRKEKSRGLDADILAQVANLNDADDSDAESESALLSVLQSAAQVESPLPPDGEALTSETFVRDGKDPSRSGEAGWLDGAGPRGKGKSPSSGKNFTDTATGSPGDTFIEQDGKNAGTFSGGPAYRGGALGGGVDHSGQKRKPESRSIDESHRRQHDSDLLTPDKNRGSNDDVGDSRVDPNDVILQKSKDVHSGRKKQYHQNPNEPAMPRYEEHEDGKKIEIEMPVVDFKGKALRQKEKSTENGDDSSSVLVAKSDPNVHKKTNAKALDKNSGKSHGWQKDDNIIVRGTQKALDDSVKVVGDGEAKQKLAGPSSNVACLIVESERFSGYLVAALGKNRNLDAKFVDTLKERLSKFLKENGEPMADDASMHLKIKPVDFEDWALEYADFLRKSVHEGEEIAMAFFPFQEAKTVVETSANAEMGAVKLDELQGDVSVEFNLYVYLPANKKYVLYTPRGSKFYGNQKDRLNRMGVTHMHVKRTELQDVSKYRAQNYLNSKIQEFEKKKSAKRAS